VTSRATVCLLVSFVCIGAPARAHHSISAVYDSGARVAFDATVVEFHLVNPHAFVIVRAETDGRMENWKFEMDNRYELVDVGMKPDALKPGDRVTVSGSRARDGSRSAYLLRLDRPGDGFWYEQVGYSPRIGGAR
jgi:hypothetical protein